MEQIVENIKKITVRTLVDTKYMYFEMILGHIGTVFAKAGVPKVNPIPQEYVEVYKDSVIEELCSGIEPDWSSLEKAKAWDTLHEDIRYTTEAELKTEGVYNRKSPYTDKTVPFLLYEKNMKKVSV